MKKIICDRHGEIAFELIESLPIGLTLSGAKEFLKGSHGHPHSYDEGEFYPKVENEYVFGYFVAKGTTLFHEEHGNGKEFIKKAKLPDGIYRLRRAVEFINNELKQVID
jgi:hypothetical protein